MILFKDGSRPWVIISVLTFGVLSAFPVPAYPHRLSYPKVIVLFLFRDKIEARINYTIAEGEEFLRFKMAFGGEPVRMRRALVESATSSLQIRLNGKTIGLSVSRATAADPHESGPYSLDIFLSSEAISYIDGSNTLEVRDSLKAWGLRAPAEAVHGHSGVPVAAYAVGGIGFLTTSTGKFTKEKVVLKDVLVSAHNPLILTFSHP